MWRRLRSATPEERALGAEALALLLAARLALWFLPCAVVRQWVDACSRWVPGAPRSADRVAWALAAVARRLPATFQSCLPRALAAEAMLRRHGAPAELVIGVRRGGAGRRVEAHAWVLSGPRVVSGWLDDLSTYVPLTSPTDRAAWSAEGGQ